MCESILYSNLPNRPASKRNWACTSSHAKHKILENMPIPILRRISAIAMVACLLGGRATDFEPRYQVISHATASRSFVLNEVGGQALAMHGIFSGIRAPFEWRKIIRWVQPLHAGLSIVGTGTITLIALWRIVGSSHSNGPSTFWGIFDQYWLNGMLIPIAFLSGLYLFRLGRRLFSDGPWYLDKESMIADTTTSLKYGVGMWMFIELLLLGKFVYADPAKGPFPGADILLGAIVARLLVPTLYYPSDDDYLPGLRISKYGQKPHYQGQESSKLIKMGYLVSWTVGGFGFVALHAVWRGSFFLWCCGVAAFTVFLSTGRLTYLIAANIRMQGSRWLQQSALYLYMTSIPFLWAANGYYAFHPNELLHHVRYSAAKLLTTVFPTKDFTPLSTGKRTNKGFDHYRIEGNHVTYDFLKIPIQQAGYEIQIEPHDHLKGRRIYPLQTFMAEVPEAVAAMTAHYPSGNVLGREGRGLEPAGLLRTHRKTIYPFDVRLLTRHDRMGEAILGMTEDGKIELIRAPSNSGQVAAMLPRYKEAMQAGPLLIENNQIVHRVKDEEPSSWTAVALDKDGNLWFVAAEAGLIGTQTHYDVARQTLLLGQSIGVHFVAEAGLDGGPLTALRTKGLFKPDIEVEGYSPWHVSVLMIVPKPPPASHIVMPSIEPSTPHLLKQSS